jgi:adenine-specific DNA-methyltransferase
MTEFKGPIYDRDGITICHGDCLSVMARMRSESIDFVLTDPPYLVNFTGRWDGEKNQIVGDNDPSWVRPAFTEIWRLLKPDSFCVSFYGWPYTDTFLGIWKSIGLRPVSHLAFVKRQWGLGRFTRGTHETAFLLAKGKPPIPETAISDVIDWQRDENAFHPNQKPVSALTPLIENYCPLDGVVLDPFMGSGSTLRAAKDLGFRAFGIEIEERFCLKASRRMSQDVFWKPESIFAPTNLFTEDSANEHRSR